MTEVPKDSILRILQRKLFVAGETIFFQGQEASKAYVVVKGAVKICKTVDGRTEVLTTIVANQLFGELGLVGGRRRSATAIAVEPTEVVVIPKEQFLAKIEKLGPVMKYWAEYLVARVDDLSSRIEN